ncbi:hypothetical protein D3C80_1309980 [compost metagenome]
MCSGLLLLVLVLLLLFRLPVTGARSAATATAAFERAASDDVAAVDAEVAVPSGETLLLSPVAEEACPVPEAGLPCSVLVSLNNTGLLWLYCQVTAVVPMPSVSRARAT